MAHYITSYTIDEEAVFNPNSLQQLSTQVCVANVKPLLLVEEQNEDGGRLKLRSDLNIPRKILWDILDKCDHNSPEYIPMILELCKEIELENLNKTLDDQPRHRIDLNDCRVVNDSQLRQMMRVRPVSLRIHNCPNLTSETLKTINEYGEKLESLNLGDSAGKILPRNLLHWTGRHDDGVGILNTPKLHHLTVWDMLFDQLNFCNLDYLERLIKTFVGGLEELELQNCKGIMSLQFLLKAKDTLTLLSLQDSLEETYYFRSDLTWAVLPHLTKLRFLDVSNCNLGGRTDIFEKLVRSLPDLSYLDLKGNGLGNRAVSEDGLGRFKINALAWREQSPLDFINLYDTKASHCEGVPARVLVRDELFNELMKALQIYRRGELSVGMLDSLEMISKRSMTDNMFLLALDLLLKVAGANFKPFSRHVFVWKALRSPTGPHELAPFQLDQIFKLMIKFLSRSWEESKTLEKVVNFVEYELSDRMDLWNPPYVDVLVPALVQAGRFAIGRYKDGRESNDAKSLLRSIARCLSDVLIETSAESQIRNVVLEHGTFELIRDAMEVDSWYLADIYEEIQDWAAGNVELASSLTKPGNT